MLDFHPQAKALFQFELRSTPDKTIPLTNNLVQHLESTIHESTEGIPICYHRFNTTQADVVDKTIKAAMTDGNPFVRYRIGLSTPTVESWLPWQEHQIVHYSAIVTGFGKESGHSFELSTSDRLYSLNRTTRIVARTGTVSGMVKGIAQAAGLDAVVEDTKGNFSYFQVNESDIEFIQRRLMNRAINDKGRGLYHLYVKDNVLHFHSPDYQATVHQLDYFQAPHHKMVQVDRSQQLWDEAASGSRMIVYDPYSGESKEFSSDPEKYLRMSDGIYRLDQVKDGKQTLLFHLGSNQASEATAIAQNVYSNGRGETFEIVMDVDKSISIRLGDILQFILAPRQDKSSPWSGYYYVTSVMRRVEKDSLRTAYTIKRGEISLDKSTVTQTNTALQLEPETTAPGQDLNIPVIQKSVLTAGAGQQESSTIFSTVEDRKTLPGT